MATKKNETTTTTTTIATAKEERAAASALRKEKWADYIASEKCARDAVGLKAKARRADVYIAKAEKTGKVSAAFARTIVRMAPALAWAADKPDALKRALAHYESELEKDKDARNFKAPSKGILALVQKVLAEGWDRATACDRAADQAHDEYKASL